MQFTTLVLLCIAFIAVGHCYQNNAHQIIGEIARMDLLTRHPDKLLKIEARFNQGFSFADMAARINNPLPFNQIEVTRRLLISQLSHSNTSPSQISDSIARLLNCIIHTLQQYHEAPSKEQLHDTFQAYSTGQNTTLFNYYQTIGLKHTGNFRMPLSEGDFKVIQRNAQELFSKYSRCSFQGEEDILDPLEWLKERKEFLESSMYARRPPGNQATKEWEQGSIDTMEKQLALTAYRLAGFLLTIF